MAASRATSAEISDVIALAGRLWAAGEQGDDERFLELDVQFHARILELSGNAMFGRLAAMTGQVLISSAQSTGSDPTGPRMSPSNCMSMSLPPFSAETATRPMRSCVHCWPLRSTRSVPSRAKKDRHIAI